MSEQRKQEELVQRASEPGAAVVSQESAEMGAASQATTTLRTAYEIEVERLTFKHDRKGHNYAMGSEPFLSRITYMVHAKGYVMCRHPGCRPFVITEKQWREFPLWQGEK